MIIHWNWGSPPLWTFWLRLGCDAKKNASSAFNSKWPYVDGSISWFSESWQVSDEGVPVMLLGESIGSFRFDLGAHSCQSLRHGGFHSKSSPAEPLHGKSTLKNATPRAVPNVVELGHQHRQEQTSMRCGRVLAPDFFTIVLANTSPSWGELSLIGFKQQKLPSYRQIYIYIYFNINEDWTSKTWGYHQQNQEFDLTWPSQPSPEGVAEEKGLPKHDQKHLQRKCHMLGS